VHELNISLSSTEQEENAFVKATSHLDQTRGNGVERINTGPCHQQSLSDFSLGHSSVPMFPFPEIGNRRGCSTVSGLLHLSKHCEEFAHCQGFLRSRKKFANQRHTFSNFGKL
jgi:hypothetical protein